MYYIGKQSHEIRKLHEQNENTYKELETNGKIKWNSRA